MIPLRRRMTEDMDLKDMPWNTQRAYLRAETQLAEFFNEPLEAFRPAWTWIGNIGTLPVTQNIVKRSVIYMQVS